MAVTQISKIQVRYGLQADLINLAAGEFAWAIDTQRLFIGNGNIDQGAPYGGMTEIVTGTVDISKLLGNYIYRGALGGYTVQTGPDLNLDVVRTWQDKVDDFVNVRDFGVTGTGNQDDTEALQRAIDQTYNKLWINVATRTKRILRLNAGIYRIDGDIKIPPYARIVGEGKDSVRIILSGTNNKFKLATSRGTDSGIENIAAEYPAGIIIKGLTFVGLNDSDLFSVDGVNAITFDDVKFSGPRFEAPIESGKSGAGITITSTIRQARNIKFTNCTFDNLSYAVKIDSVVGTYDVNFSNCIFNNLYCGIYVNNGGTPIAKDIKVSNSIFEKIATYGIFGSLEVRGIVSLGNTYNDVASNFEGDIDLPVSDWYPVLVLQAHGNYSIADSFGRSLPNSIAYPRVSSNGFDTVSMSIDESFNLGNSKYTAGRRIPILSGKSGFVVLNNFKHGTISYSVTRDKEVRIGYIKVIGSLESDAQIAYDDDYTETSDIGIRLAVSKLQSKLRISWNTVDTGVNLVLVYDTKTLD
jgi:hypothetical protein